MSLPKKGSRKAIIDGITYRFNVRRDMADMGEGHNKRSALFVFVQEDKPDVSVLVCSIPGESVVTVPLVSDIIAAAVAKGWRPSESGPTFHMVFELQGS